MDYFVETDFLSEGYVLKYELSSSQLYLNEEKRSILCILMKEYVPIEDFKNTFNEISILVEKHDLKTFIFDKRSLTTFHQPSMEWYYVQWKTNMLKHGLSNHRKILPKAGWFRKAVEIAHRDIESRIDQEIFKKIDVHYAETMQEALDF